jgi:hypothetical protein
VVVLQPRKRISRPAGNALTETALPRGVSRAQLGAGWLLRTTHAQRSTLLAFLQRHLDPTWEAVVNPPVLPLD